MFQIGEFITSANFKFIKTYMYNETKTILNLNVSPKCIFNFFFITPIFYKLKVHVCYLMQFLIGYCAQSRLLYIIELL